MGKTKPEHYLGLLILIAVTGLLLFLRFPDMAKGPNSGVIEPYGDGIKAYTVIEYHARHDSTFSYFEGMNYPYREHVVPAATQPLISNSIKWVSTYLTDITPYTKGILHGTLLLGLLLCAVFLYLIFRKLGTSVWWAIGVAIGLTFLSPQLHRMISHYGLAHPEVLPVIFYLLLRLEEDKRWRTSWWIAGATVAFSLIHFYCFAIISFTISLYFLFGFLRKPSWPRLLRYAGHYSIQLLLPLAFFFYWMYWEDPVADRTEHPWGFFHYKAIWEGIFTSPFQPHYQWIDQNIIKIQVSNFEGMAYTGLVATFAVLFLLGRWFWFKCRRPIVYLEGDFNGYVNKLFWTGAVLLFLSFCWPFNWPGLQGLAEYTGPLRQFRSLGRFSWVFYYALNIATFALLWQWAAKKQWRLAIAIPALAFLCFEAYHHALGRDFRLDEVKELRADETYNDIPGVNYDEFQAILTVPYYNIGSDNFWYPGDGEILPRSQILSVQTGLPTTSAMLTRTSLSQTLRQLELITEPYRVPAVLSDYPSDKPLLLLVSNHKYEQQKEKYAHLLEEVQPLYGNDSYQMFRMPLNAFEQRIEQRKLDISHTLVADSLTLRTHGDFLTHDADPTFVYHNYDSLAADSIYRGGGALAGTGADKTTIYEGNIPQQTSGGYYICSVWMHLGGDANARSWAHLVERAEDGAEINRTSYAVNNQVAVLDREWALLELLYVPQRTDSHLYFYMENDNIGDAPLYWDELLIRPKVSDVYRDDPAYWFKNNRWFPK